MAKKAPKAKKKNPQDVTQYALRKIRRQLKEHDSQFESVAASLDTIYLIFVSMGLTPTKPTPKGKK